MDNMDSFDQAIADAKAKADRDRRATYIAEALGDIFTAQGVARGGKPIDPSFFQSLRAGADQDVSQAEAQKKQAIADWYRSKQFDRQGEMDRINAEQRAADEAWRQKQYEARETKDQRDYEQRERQIQATRAATQAKSDEKKQKELDELTVAPGVVARTKDDAKKLKESIEKKEKFDRTLQEMIDLRNEYGVEYANREAVERGKQLSKDLLLTYKDLAKLGVLSKADEDIINAIIPEDPLGQDWMPGQDSIMNRLVKFKGDVNADYETSFKTRVNPDRSTQGLPEQQAPQQKPSWAK